MSGGLLLWEEAAERCPAGCSGGARTPPSRALSCGASRPQKRRPSLVLRAGLSWPETPKTVGHSLKLAAAQRGWGGVAGATAPHRAGASTERLPCRPGLSSMRQPIWCWRLGKEVSASPSPPVVSPKLKKLMPRGPPPPPCFQAWPPRLFIQKHLLNQAQGPLSPAFCPAPSAGAHQLGGTPGGEKPVRLGVGCL